LGVGLGGGGGGGAFSLHFSAVWHCQRTENYIREQYRYLYITID
jgi:hypothetical protein